MWATALSLCEAASHFASPEIRDIVSGESGGFPLTGMVVGVDLFELLIGDVRVELGRGDAFMAEQFLDGAKVGTVTE